MPQKEGPPTSRGRGHIQGGSTIPSRESHRNNLPGELVMTFWVSGERPTLSAEPSSTLHPGRRWQLPGKGWKPQMVPAVPARKKRKKEFPSRTRYSSRETLLRLYTNWYTMYPFSHLPVVHVLPEVKHFTIYHCH